MFEKLFIIVLLFSCLQFVLLYRWNPEENPGLFEGDIVLRPNQLKHDMGSGANGYAATTAKLWPNPVPYEYLSSLTKIPEAVGRIEKALKDIESQTCIRFKRVFNASESLIFFQGKGCYSHVGFYSQWSGVSLSRGCWKSHGKILHEVGHALGFYHEQARPDRDNYIKIIWDRIPKVYHHQFNKYSIKYIDSLNVPYDVDSVMHYSSTAFVGGKIDFTIKTLDPTLQRRIGQRKGFSKLDILQLNLLYKCPGFKKPGGTLAPWSPPTTKGPRTRPTRKPTSPTTTRATTRAPSTRRPGPLKQVFICEGQSQKTIWCPTGRQLKITYELYGRILKTVCKTGNFTPTGRCYSYKKTFGPKCNGKSSCNLYNDKTLSDKVFCPTVTKYLQVQYRCNYI